MYLILGLGVSNKAVINKLKDLNKDFILVVNNNETESASKYSSNLITFEMIKYLDLTKIKYVIKSPGIPYHNKYVKYLKSKYLKIINEIELTYILTKKRGKYIGVSGSVGKSSVVSLLYELIKSKNDNVILAGNIGIPLISQSEHINEDTIIVLELSSYQLDDFVNMRLDIALLLNIYDNHLDVYRSKESYYLSKFKLTNNQTNKDYFIVNLDNLTIKKYLLNHCFKSNIIDYMSGFVVKGNYLFYYKDKIVNLDNYLLKGSHNIDNLKSIICILNILNIRLSTRVLKEFHPLDYHLKESIKKEIIIVNDSKSTCTESLKSAIETYKDKNIILLFGGYNKNLNFNFLSKYKFKKLLCFGGLTKYIDNMVNVDEKFNSLSSASKYAFQIANKNDVILFSPGCASFDEFDNYKDRGKFFDELVKEFYHE